MITPVMPSRADDTRASREKRRTSASMRSGIVGWLDSRSAKPERGLSRHISITEEGTPSISPRPSILRRAEIRASGFLVSSTAPASARNSRERMVPKRGRTSSRNFQEI